MGLHLTRHLLESGDEVHGLVHLPEELAAASGPLAAPTLHLANLADAEALRGVLARVRPRWVFHLAAQSSPSDSLHDPVGTLSVNILCQANLLTVLAELGCAERVLIVGSSEEYGPVEPTELPVRETAPLRPQNPYAVSKIAQDYLGYQFYRSHGLPCVRVRPFNHIGPGQSERFVAGDFARQVALAELAGRPARVRCGNLSARRDFTDVRDIVRAYRLALARGEPGEVYNIGRGEAAPVQALLDALAQASRVPVVAEVEPQRLRANDVPVLICDPSKFRAATGWAPAIPLAQTMADALQVWREKLATRADASLASQ